MDQNSGICFFVDYSYFHDMSLLQDLLTKDINIIMIHRGASTSSATGKPNRSDTALLLREEHRVPGRKKNRLLIKHIHDIGRHVLLLKDETEHVVVEPLVGHDEVALVA